MAAATVATWLAVVLPLVVLNVWAGPASSARWVGPRWIAGQIDYLRTAHHRFVCDRDMAARANRHLGWHRVLDAATPWTWGPRTGATDGARCHVTVVTTRLDEASMAITSWRSLSRSSSLTCARADFDVEFIGWIALIVLVFDPLPWGYDRLTYSVPMWIWRLVLVTPALWLSLSALLDVTRASRGTTHRAIPSATGADLSNP